MKKKTNTINFTANVRLGKGLDPVAVDFSVSTENNARELSLTWDEVFDEAIVEAERKFSPDDFPKMEIEEIFIVTDDGKFPVLDEEQGKNISDKNEYGKVLVLPFATYSLTPEYKMFVELTEKGFINGEFDADAMRKIIDVAKDENK